MYRSERFSANKTRASCRYRCRQNTHLFCWPPTVPNAYTIPYKDSCNPLNFTMTARLASRSCRQLISIVYSQQSLVGSST